MAYYILKTVKGKRLFTTKNIRLEEVKKMELKNKVNNYNNTENAEIVGTLEYDINQEAWIRC